MLWINAEHKIYQGPFFKKKITIWNLCDIGRFILFLSFFFLCTSSSSSSLSTLKMRNFHSCYRRCNRNLVIMSQYSIQCRRLTELMDTHKHSEDVYFNLLVFNLFMNFYTWNSYFFNMKIIDEYLYIF